MKNISSIIDLYEQYGHQHYGEQLSQGQHAVQVAQLAEQNQASDALIAACLLHDIGHLLYNSDIAELGINDRHEILGAQLLQPLFGDDVAEPIKLHIRAKRYLCSIDNGYYHDLSSASMESLQLQGGFLTPTQILKFEESPYFDDSINLRQWDDMGKNTQLADTDISHYRPLLNDLCSAS